MERKKLSPKVKIALKEEYSSDESFDDDDSVGDSDYEDFSGFSDDNAEAELQQQLNDLLIEEDNGHEDDDHNLDSGVYEPQWSEFNGRQKKINFTGKQKFQVPVPADVTPMDVFNLLIDDGIWNMIVVNTNTYAAQEMV